MRFSLRQRVLIVKTVIILVLAPLLAWGAQRYYLTRLAQPETVMADMPIVVMVLLPALVFVCLDLLASSYFSSRSAQRLLLFARQVREGKPVEVMFPELRPVVEAISMKERQLKAESGKVEWIVRHIPGGLVTINRDEQITLAICPAFEDLGLPVNDLMGKPVAAFHELIGITRAHSPMIDALKRGIKSRRISLVGGRYFEAVNTPMINDAGELNGAVCLFVDVTERVRQEQEMKRLERLSLVGQMSASLSHEIRNPLTVIRGYLQLHAAKETDELSQGQFALLIEEIDRVSQIVQQLLAISHGGGGEWFQMSLAQLVGQLSPLLKSEADIHDITLQLELLDTPDLLLNSSDMKQLLLNLYRNAVEACSGQTGMVQVSTGVDGKGRPYLRVRDNGCGMPTQVLERLGTPFNSTKANGTGLGLPLCLSVAEAHGAELRFQPNSGGGTVATVLFPLPQAEEVIRAGTN